MKKPCLHNNLKEILRKNIYSNSVPIEVKDNVYVPGLILEAYVIVQ